MYINSLSISEFQELIDSNPAIQQLVDYINNDNTMTMRKITHEVNNVITLINSSLQIIEFSHPEVKSFKYWDSTMNDLKHLIKLVSEISLFNNSNYLSPVETNIADMFKNIISSFNSLNTNISITLNQLNDIPIIISDSTKLNQVFINLIKNAFEALENTPSPYIHISLEYANEYISILIEDNGCGMTPEQLDNIFNPMVSYKTTGTGLGLAISKKIVEAHNGSITVTSKPNCGTAFTIKIPV